MLTVKEARDVRLAVVHGTIYCTRALALRVATSVQHFNFTMEAWRRRRAAATFIRDARVETEPIVRSQGGRRFFGAARVLYFDSPPAAAWCFFDVCFGEWNFSERESEGLEREFMKRGMTLLRALGVYSKVKYLEFRGVTAEPLARASFTRPDFSAGRAASWMKTRWQTAVSVQWLYALYHCALAANWFVEPFFFMPKALRA